MRDRIKSTAGSSSKHSGLISAYNAVAYNCTKVILTPVMGAITDMLNDTISDAVNKGVQDALSGFAPKGSLGRWISGQWGLLTKESDG